MGKGPHSVYVGLYLNKEEHALVQEEARAAGFKSPAQYIRALFREHLAQDGKLHFKTIARKQAHDRIVVALSRHVSAYIRSLTEEEMAHVIHEADLQAGGQDAAANVPVKHHPEQGDFDL